MHILAYLVTFLTIPLLLNAEGLGPEQAVMSAERAQEVPSSSETHAEHAQPVAAAYDDDDDAPMVHKTPADYRSWALEERKKLQAEGHEVVLQSEVGSLVRREPDEAPADYAKRYVEAMNAMIGRGVMILNDVTTANVRPDKATIGGRKFDIGSGSGITKKEYREFSEWVDSFKDVGEDDIPGVAVPEKFRKFEIPKGTFDARDEADESRDEK